TRVKPPRGRQNFTAFVRASLSWIIAPSRWLRLKRLSVDRQAIVTVAEAAVSFRIDRVIHQLDRAIAKCRVETIQMGAAEPVRVIEAGCVGFGRNIEYRRWSGRGGVCGPACDFAVVAYHRPVVFAIDDAVGVT